MIRSILYLLLILNTVITQAQNVSDYTIAIHFFPEDAQMWGYPVSNQTFMRGNSTVEFSEINKDELTFYLHGELKIDSIRSGNKRIEFSYEKVLYPGDYSNVGLKTTIASSAIQENTLSIHYSGFMNPSRARSLSDYMRIDKEEGVFLRAYYYSPWFPIFLELNEDDQEVNFKKITITLPNNFSAVVSGELLSETRGDTNYTAIWKPGLSYLTDLQCTARNYEVISKGNILVYYVSERKNGQEIIDFTQQLKQLFSSNLKAVHKTSPLYIIEMPEYGNISNQNVIGISTDIYKNFNKELSSRITIAHELVHPYVAIPITNENPFAALVVEGFPSFFHLYGLNKIANNSDDFHLYNYMKRVEKDYIKKKNTGKDRRGNKLPSEVPILKIPFNKIGQYKDSFILSDRVLLFLNHLWNEMGDQDFDRFVKSLFQLEGIDYEKVESLIEAYLPGYKKQLNIWLNTIDYPESLHIKNGN